MRSRWVVGLDGPAAGRRVHVAGRRRAVGGPSDESSSNESVGPVDLAVPVELSRVISTTPSGSPPVPPTSLPPSTSASTSSPTSTVQDADGNSMCSRSRS